MNPLIFMLFSLMLNSLLLAVILLIGWRMFGRPRHAATWAGAFSAATALWLTDLVELLSAPELSGLRLVSSVLAPTFAILLLLGFRQRAGLASGVILFAGVFAGMAAAIAIMFFIPANAAPRTAPILVVWALILGLSATTLIGRGRRPNPAERVALVVLLGFALFSLAMAAFGIGIFVGDAEQGLEVYRLVLRLVAPAAFIAVGLAAVFLLAADLAEQMRLLATVDPLTGVLNRRGLMQAATLAIANCKRHSQPITAVIADLDRFKAINDAFGHAVGDCALQLFARHVSGTLRVGDPIGRIGGEEFAFLLVNTSATAAVEVVERIRASMTTLALPGGADAAMTASFGVATLKPGETTFEEVLDRADAALYASKLAGRDRVSLSDG